MNNRQSQHFLMACDVFSADAERDETMMKYESCGSRLRSSHFAANRRRGRKSVGNV